VSDSAQDPGPAPDSGGAQQRNQKRRLFWVIPVAASYALDTLFLGLFAAIGTVPREVPLAYCGVAAGAVGAQYAVYANGWNLQARDPNLLAPWIAVGVALQLGVVAMAPQIAFPYLANLFTVFAFGMAWLPLRASLIIWSLCAVAVGVLLYAVGDRIGVPVATGVERLLAALYFSLILARCLVLSVQANELRARLADSRSKLAASLAQVQQLASHDELTGALNRRSLIARLDEERRRAQRSGVPFHVAMLDLDRFKAVNDTYGHGVGDEVLKAFAATVRDTRRTTDVYGRYGGEEFLVILVSAEAAPALAATERIRAAVEARDWGEIAPGLKVTVSAGVAGFRHGESIEQLVNRADEAMYAAKRAGRNRIVAGD